jgi:hypothetical protein
VPRGAHDVERRRVLLVDVVAGVVRSMLVRGIKTAAVVAHFRYFPATTHGFEGKRTTTTTTTTPVVRTGKMTQPATTGAALRSRCRRRLLLLIFLQELVLVEDRLDHRRPQLEKRGPVPKRRIVAFWPGRRPVLVLQNVGQAVTTDSSSSNGTSGSGSSNGTSRARVAVLAGATGSSTVGGRNATGTVTSQIRVAAGVFQERLERQGVGAQRTCLSEAIEVPWSG